MNHGGILHINGIRLPDFRLWDTERWWMRPEAVLSADYGGFSHDMEVVVTRVHHQTADSEFTIFRRFCQEFPVHGYKRVRAVNSCGNK